MGTAHWGEDGICWRWSDGGVEATAFALRALLAIDPKNALVEPVTNWLVEDRRGAQWSQHARHGDHRAGAERLSAHKRRARLPMLITKLRVNGQSVADAELSRFRSALAHRACSRSTASCSADGANQIRIVRKGGTGPLYFAAQARFFSLEEPVSPRRQRDLRPPRLLQAGRPPNLAERVRH